MPILKPFLFAAQRRNYKKKPFMKIVLFQPDIAQNFGAVMRICACFDTPLEVIEPCGFPLTAKALRRAAMDYGAPETVTRHEGWDAYAAKKEAGRLVLFTTRASEPLPDFTFRPDDRLIFGRESAGAPDYVHAASDARLRIPISPAARSLNLATSVSLALYDALRQTGGLPETT